ncbi:uncharacterized protein [Musca autumnalis]|uniref:uncharacterized protein n=1 Tax=Musca autumnalis TaxID=221902 RepID=UPI003CF04AB7
MVKITTRQQFEMLFEKMQEHPNLARGVRAIGETKATFNEVWKDIAKQLNSCGPPTRTPREWHRVWTHFKSKLKKKLTTYKMISLSPMEKSIVDLLQFNEVSKPTGAIYEIVETWDDNSSENEHSQNRVEIDDNVDQNKKNITTTGGGRPSQGISLSSSMQFNAVSNPAGAFFEIVETWDDSNSEIGQAQNQEEIDDNVRSTTQRKSNKTEDPKMRILEEQTATQSQLLKSINSLVNAINKQNDILTETKNLQKEQNDLLKETNNLKRKKLDILKELKDMKKKKYDVYSEDQEINFEMKKSKLQLLKIMMMDEL